MRKQFSLRTIIAVFLSSLCVNAMIINCTMARDRNVYNYSNAYRACLNDSNGREDIYSVQWACNVAAGRYINACSAWIGASDSVNGIDPSKTTSIYSKISVLDVKPGEKVDAKLYGMCTAVDDTARRVWTVPSGIVTFGGKTETGTFTRTTWGSPNSTGAEIDIAKFISGVSPRTEGDYYVYTRDILLYREHSTGGSISHNNTRISLYVLRKSPSPDIPEPNIPVPDPGCDSDTPKDFTGNEYNGNVSIGVDSINRRTGSRSSSMVWARPDDEVVWDNHYVANTPGAAEKIVSEVDVSGSNIYRGYTELSDSMCQPYGGLCSRRLPVQNKRLIEVLRDKGYSWKNIFTVYIDAKDNANLVTQIDQRDFGEYSYNVNTNVNENYTRRINRTGDVGKVLTETARAGTYSAGSFVSSGSSGSDILQGDDGLLHSDDDGLLSDDSEEKTGLPSYVKISYSNPTKSVTNQVCTIKQVGVEYYGILTDTDGEGTYRGSGDIDSRPPSGYFKDNEYAEIPIYDNDCSGTKTCVNSYDSAINKAEVEVKELKDSASVSVPYNYTNSSHMDIPNKPVYSGEAISGFQLYADVRKKYNYSTMDEYATIVPQSKVKVFAYISKTDRSGGSEKTFSTDNGCSSSVISGSASAGTKKQCAELYAGDGGILNQNGNLNGENNIPISMPSIGALDASAGDYICFVSAIWPASSGIDTQMGPTGDNLWRYSGTTCRIIAKRPTFQVWGGDMYSEGSVDTKARKKKNVYSNYSSSMKVNGSDAKTITFSSWVDHGLNINNGGTTNLASGAATGATNASGVAKTGNTGSFCVAMSPLSFASCKSGAILTSSVGYSGIASGAGSDREGMLRYWLGTEIDDISDGWAEKVSNDGSKLEYYHASGSIDYSSDIGDGHSLVEGTTQLIMVDGTLTIDKDIRYNGTIDITTAKKIPKLIIYAKNIDIKCDVTEVDAILITKARTTTDKTIGTLDTCSDAHTGSDGKIGTIATYNAVNRSKQLKIYGTVIVDKVVFGRTYGGAAWKGSGANGEKEAAEIFDYDSSIIMWAGQKSSTSATSALQKVYQREAAPRY